jgi:lipopolysaccharide/colanic/teichoic acid biosynthesis glycosyltransferase
LAEFGPNEIRSPQFPDDLYYIKHQSLWLDIVILLKTIVDTLTLRGR